MLTSLPIDQVSEGVATRVPELYILATALLSALMVGAGLLTAFLRYNRTLTKDRAEADSKRDKMWMQFLTEGRQISQKIGDECHRDQRELANGYQKAMIETAGAMRQISNRMATHDEVMRSTAAILQRVHSVLDRNGVTRAKPPEGRA